VRRRTAGAMRFDSTAILETDGPSPTGVKLSQPSLNIRRYKVLYTVAMLRRNTLVYSLRNTSPSDYVAQLIAFPLRTYKHS
jgi:hypothetical protein